MGEAKRRRQYTKDILPDAMFIRSKQQTTAWLAGYLVMMTWPQTGEAQKQIVTRVTDNLMRPGIPSKITPGENVLLWEDGSLHTFEEPDMVERVKAAKVLQLIVLDVGEALCFTTIELSDDDNRV